LGIQLFQGKALYTKILPPKKIELLNFQEIWQYRELFGTLAIRDIKLRYRQTLLGVVWVMIQPLFTSAIFTLIFGKLGKMPSGDVPYEVLTFIALLPWTLVSQSIQRASGSLVRDIRMVTRVFFPRIIIPVSSTVSALLDFLVSFFVLLIILFIYRISMSWRVLVLPILVLFVWLIAISVSLLISAFNVYYRDFQYAVSFILQVWMYISPVAYSTSIIPENWRLVYALNPIVGIVESFRWVFINSMSFPVLEFSITVIFLLIAFPVSTLVFQKIEKYFADVI
jgi:lipopolysaccharide transport system permease protein